MENNVNKQNEGFGTDDGARKISTAYYAELLKQQIAELSKMIEWRKQNIQILSGETQNQEFEKEEPQIGLVR